MHSRNYIKRTVADHDFHAGLPHLVFQGHGKIQKLNLHEMAPVRDRWNCHVIKYYAIN